MKSTAAMEFQDYTEYPQEYFQQQDYHSTRTIPSFRNLMIQTAKDKKKLLLQPSSLDH